MLFSLRIDLSFLLILHLCLKLLLFLNFDDDSPYESFKLGFVYGRQRPILFLPKSHLPFEFAQTIPWPRDSNYKMLLVDLLRVFRPLDRYDFFSYISSCYFIIYYNFSCYSKVKHEYWRKTMADELQALQESQTWDVPCPTNVKAIDCT